MSFDYVSGDDRYAHEGDYGLELAQDTGTSSYLYQGLETTPGTTYLLSFWLNSMAGVASFTAYWGTHPSGAQPTYPPWAGPTSR